MWVCEHCLLLGTIQRHFPLRKIYANKHNTVWFDMSHSHQLHRYSQGCSCQIKIQTKMARAKMSTSEGYSRLQRNLERIFSSPKMNV